jgi:hypothetical protein
LEQKKTLLKAQFNSIEVNPSDPTILTGTIIIHDFLKSWNNQVISEEICQENMNTLIGKRVVCNYIPCENNNGIDALTDHEDTIGYDRNTGNEMIITNTLAIGFINEVYIDDYTDKDGNTKRVLYGKVVIWNDDKYKNIAGLLKEWLDRGIKIHMSVEYLYVNYQFIDGVEYVLSPIVYTAHTILNSEQRGEYLEVLPAYDDAQLLSFNDRQSWNKALNQIINKNKKEDDKRMDNVFLKSLNNLSFGDIRDKIYADLATKMTAAEYQYIWISSYGLFDDYFVYENYENGKYVNYKVSYTKTDNDEVIVDISTKQPAEFKGEWVAITEYQISQNSLKVAQDKIIELEKKLEEKETALNSLNSKGTGADNVFTVEKFNELTETITVLNSKVKEMQPLVDKYNEEQYEKSLNNAKDFYKEKFEGVDALEEYESEDIQTLVKQSINSNQTEAGKAQMTLSNKILSHVKVSKNEKTEPKFSVNSITEPCKDNKNLTKDFVDEFEQTFGFSKE